MKTTKSNSKIIDMLSTYKMLIEFYQIFSSLALRSKSVEAISHNKRISYLSQIYWAIGVFVE